MQVDCFQMNDCFLLVVLLLVRVGAKEAGLVFPQNSKSPLPLGGLGPLNFGFFGGVRPQN